MANHVISFKSVIKTFFDVLHGIEAKDVPLVVALELAIFLGFDGQLKQDSVMEKELFESTIAQARFSFNQKILLGIFNCVAASSCKGFSENPFKLKEKKMSTIENALMWLYIQTWGLQGKHVIDDVELWNFDGEDLEAALNKILYPRKNNKTEKCNKSQMNLIEELRKLIMGKFDDDKNAFYEWSQTIHDEVSLGSQSEVRILDFRR